MYRIDSGVDIGPQDLSEEVFNRECLRCVERLDWQVFYLSEASSPPMAPYVLPSPYTLYTCILYTVYSFLLARGGGGGG
jgi:hypothetical protein